MGDDLAIKLNRMITEGEQTIFAILNCVYVPTVEDQSSCGRISSGAMVDAVKIGGPSGKTHVLGRRTLTRESRIVDAAA
jgi:hypothetical protein